MIHYLQLRGEQVCYDCGAILPGVRVRTAYDDEKIDVEQVCYECLHSGLDCLEVAQLHRERTATAPYSAGIYDGLNSVDFP